MTIIISETMEELHKRLGNYMAIHRGMVNEEEVLNQGIRDAYGDVDPGEVLRQAEINSLKKLRARNISDPKKNRIIDTTAQGDLFNNVPVKVPSILIVDGKPRPYYEVSILDGLEWWRARQDAKRAESAAFREAAEQSEDQSRIAADQCEKIEYLVRKAEDSGVNPRDVRYAKE